jgi:hypothetical protein
VIDVAAPVEHDFRDSLGFGALGDGFADRLGGSHVASSALLALLAFGGVRGYQSVAVEIVDYLNINMIQRTVHVQARPLGGAENLFAYALMHVPPVCVL